MIEADRWIEAGAAGLRALTGRYVAVPPMARSLVVSFQHVALLLTPAWPAFLYHKTLFLLIQSYAELTRIREKKHFILDVRNGTELGMSQEKRT